MKVYPPDAAERLGFDTILRELARLSETDPIREQFLHLQPSHNPLLIRESLVQTKAYMRLLMQAEYPRDIVFREIQPYLKKALPQNAWLSAEEIFRVILWLRTLRVLLAFIEKKKDDFPELLALIPAAERPFGLQEFLAGHFTSEGQLKDNASPELGRLRKGILETGHKVRRLTEKIHKAARDQGWSDAREVSIRNNRLVIPLNADFKGRIEGFVQDVSQSGQTIFIEPAEALPLNNELSLLQLKERQEIIRILTDLTDHLRAKMPELKVWEEWLQKMEILQARAKFSTKIQADIPQLDPSGDCLKIVQGRNPLLVLQIQQAVVPLDLDLNRQQRILLISGPNAGGKSVALKTAGILQWMVQCGLPVPADSSSIFPVLASLFTVVGDGQSIENDLSTYTAHLSHMRYLLERAHESSLFLIDEFGSGTDPRSGGPIAVALLEALVEQGALGIVTTHYSDLKQLARRNPAVRNAAMHFDLKDFKPSYQLEMGHAGSSYAFEIARKAGIPESVLRRGKTLMGKAPAETEELLTALNRDKEEILKLQEKLGIESLENQKIRDKLNLAEREAKEKVRKLIADAREQARGMLTEASKKIGELVQETREKQLEKKVAKSIQKELMSFIPDIDQGEEVLLDPIPGFKEVIGVDPVIGDRVKWFSTGAIGRVLDIMNGRFVIAFGDIRTSLKREEIILLKTEEDISKIKVEISAQTRADHKMNATITLDIRGQRMEPAQLMLQKFLDDAFVNGLPFVHIIHGKGNGILRTMTRDMLKRAPGVKRVEEPPIEQGGAGATDAYFN